MLLSPPPRIPALLVAGTVFVFTSVALAQSPVVVAPVVEKEVATGQAFVGTIVPVKRAIVGSAVDGRVSEFPLNAGQRVENGGTLAQILTSTIELELKAASEEAKALQAELDELEEGPRVQEKSLAEAELESARASAELAAVNLERAKQLARNGTVTQSMLDTAEATQKVAARTLDARQADFDLINAGTRKERILQAQARLAMQAAVVERLEDQIAKYTVRSRFAGYVIAEHTEIGAWVKRGDPVAEVAALDFVDVEAHVLDQQVVHAKKGLRVRVEVSAVDDRVRTGVIEYVVPQADVRTRTFPVLVRLKNDITDDEPLLKAGMLARVHLPTGALRKSMLVAKDAIVLGGARPMVFVVDRASKNDPAGTVRPVPVTLGVAAGNAIAVTGDLKPGEEIVVRGNERVRPGQPVSVAEVVEVKVDDEPFLDEDADTGDESETPSDEPAS